MNTLQNVPNTYGEVVTVNVDPQNDFCPGGRLPVEDGDAVIPPLNAINTWTRQNHGLVVASRDWHPKDTKHFAANGGIWPEHCVQNRAGAAFHDDLVLEAFDTIVSKGMGLEEDGYSAYMAQLDTGTLVDIVADLPPAQRTLGVALERVANTLRNSKRSQRLLVAFGGLATDHCVLASAIDTVKATRRLVLPDGTPQVDVVVLTDAIRAVNLKPGDGDRALQAMLEARVLARTTEEVMQGFRIER